MNRVFTFLSIWFCLLAPAVTLASSCSMTFNSALQIHDPDGKITFKNSAKVINDSDNVLETTSIDDQSQGNTCDTEDCVASNTFVSPLDIDTFQFQSGGQDVSIPGGDVQVLSGNIRNYDSIDIGNGGILTFSSGASEPIYKIERLDLKNSAVLNLESGTYWIREFIADNSVEINVIGNGMVTIIVNEIIQFKNSTAINKNGSASQLFIYAFNDVITHNSSEVKAFIYSKETVEMKDSSYIKGAVLAKNIELKSSAIVEYDSNGAINIDLSNICTGSLVDHFRINTSSQGSYCTPHKLEVYAEDNHGQIVDYTGTMTLNTGTGAGTWSKISGSGTFSDSVSDDGLATYKFAESDEGVASFYLHYTHGTSPINVAIVDQSNPYIKDDDTEGLIYFISYQVWLTSEPVVDINNVSPFTETIVAGDTDTVYLTLYGPEGSGCGIMTSDSSSKELKFWSEYSDPTSGTRTALVNGVSSGTSEANSPTYTIDFVEGRSSISINYQDVGLIRLHTAEIGSFGESGSTGYFVTKPANFVLSVAQNPSAEDASGGVFKTAGNSFSINVSVVDSLGGVVPNYGNEKIPEGVRVSIGELVAPANGYTGNLSNPLSFVKQSPGVFSSSSVIYDEVGIIKLYSSIADSDYLGIGDVIGSNSENIGRFIPDHFTFVVNAPVISTGVPGAGFSYIGQDLIYSGDPQITITAKNTDGTITENYIDDFFKVQSGNVTVSYSSNSPEAILNTTAADTDIVVSAEGSGVGTVTLSDGGGFSFDKAPGINASPFNAEIQIDVDIADSDGVTTQPDTVIVGGTEEGTGISFSAGNLFYQGRVVLGNTFGSELLSLAVPYVIEFFNGTDYVQNINSLDNLQDIIILTPLVPGLNTSSILVGQIQGLGSIILQAPNPSVSGDVNVELDLTAMPYLQHDWPHDGNMDGQFDDNPRSKATFGIYGGDDVMVNIKELY